MVWYDMIWYEYIDLHGPTWTEHRLCRQQPAKPANNHYDVDGAEADADSDAADDVDTDADDSADADVDGESYDADTDADADADESNLLHGFSIPASTPELR